MNYWQQREADLLKQENAWLDELSPFMRMVDSHVGYIVLSWFGMSLAFVIGAAIGFLL